MGIDSATNPGNLLRQDLEVSHSPLGRHSTSQLQLFEALSHGETHPLQRIWSSWLLLYSQACQQLGRTSTVTRSERHRQSHHLLERQTCSSPYASSSTLASVTYLDKDLLKLMTNHTAVMKPHLTTLQQTSTAVVFTKNPSVMDSLCNHKEFATRWAYGEEPTCTCDTLQPHIESNTTTTPSSHFCGRRHLDFFIGTF